MLPAMPMAMHWIFMVFASFPGQTVLVCPSRAPTLSLHPVERSANNG